MLRNSLKLCLGFVVLSLALLESSQLKAQVHGESVAAWDSSSLAEGSEGQQTDPALQTPLPVRPEFPVTHERPWNRISAEMSGGYAPVVSRGAGYYGDGFSAAAGATARLNSHWRAQAEGQILGQHGPSSIGNITSDSGEDGIAPAYIFAVHLDGLYYLSPAAANSLYLIGGAGYYHLGTHVYCTSSQKQNGCTTGSDSPFTTDLISVNAAGFNVGAGMRHKLYAYYSERHTELFAEARFHYIASGSSAVGQVSMLPISVGIRW